MTTQRILAAGLAVFGAAGAIPISLAQLDFAGVLNAFNVDAGDATAALRVLAGAGGFLTFAVIVLAFVGAWLVITGRRSARTVLITSSVAGFATAAIFWIPAGVTIGAAALLLGRAELDDPASAARASAGASPGRLA